MSSDTLFAQAIEIASPREREEFLVAACQGDPELHREVQQLVRNHFRAGAFLERPAGGVAIAVEEATVGERPGTQIGPYKLLEQVGEGGFGAVFLAEQTGPVCRTVALKMLKPGMDTRQVIARFEAERQALAMMDHPNIAKVFDGGATPSGRPYLVMELVRGVPITEFCDQNHRTPRQRLELFLPVCQAVQHAHQKGIIHRDLKPSNILVVMHDATPVPQVIDFGIAKVLGQEQADRTVFTACGQMIGTPLYMSPEQAGQDGRDVDTRSDIYSLGVLLYELLTGTTPLTRERFQQAGFDEIRRIIREEEPPRPSTRLSEAKETLSAVAAQRHTEPAKLTRLVRGELDWIVMKCLEKDRGRRYETANALALDVQRYLNDEPVQACPPSAGYRLRKFARRHKGRLAVTASVFVAVTVAAASIGWAVRDRAAQAEESARAEITRRAGVAGPVRDSLIAARTLVADNKLALARQKLVQARAQLGSDWSALGELAADVEAGEASLDRFQQFLDLIERAHEAETTPANEPALAADAPAGNAATPALARARERRPAAAVPFLLEALRRFDVLERDNWDNALEGGLLGRPQVELIRRLAYEELLWLADDVARRRQEHRSGRTLSPEAAARAALVYLGKAEGAHPPTQALYTLRAGCRKALGEEAAAQADRQRADQAPPTMALDHYLRGQAAYDANQLAEGVRAFDAALGQESTHYWSMMKLGYCLCDLGRGREDFLGAVRVFHGCILKRPDHAHAYYCRANAYANLRDDKEAVADYSRAIERDQEHILAWFSRGIAHNNLDQLDRAVADFSQAIKLDPKFARAWNNRGVAYHRQGKQQKAVADYSQAIQLDPKFAVARSNRGAGYLQLGELNRALTDCTQAIEIDPTLALAWTSRGSVYSQLGQSQKAIDDLSRAIELEPMSARAWNARGNAYLRAGQPDRALTDCTRATELDPKLALAWNNRGSAHYKLDRPEKAIDDYSQAIDLDPKLALAWTNRGKVRLEFGQPGKALADCNQAVKLDPLSAAAWLNRGAAYFKLAQPNEALKDFSKVIELDPKSALGWLNRGVVHVGLEQPDKAVADLSRAIDLAPKHPHVVRAYLLRALALGQLARFEQARADYEVFLRHVPNHTRSHDALAWILATCPDVKQRDPVRAVALARKAVELEPRVGVYWKTLGVAQYRAGEWQAAVASLSRSQTLRKSGDAVDRFFLAMAHHKLGNHDMARQAYERAVQWLEDNKGALKKARVVAEQLRSFRVETEEVLKLKKK
jgi:tetratricopeptide (TPR) repeat protein/serine/threonine protein kinase